jgi:hypothetical protein
MMVIASILFFPLAYIGMMVIDAITIIPI